MNHEQDSEELSLVTTSTDININFHLITNSSHFVTIASDTMTPTTSSQHQLLLLQQQQQEEEEGGGGEEMKTLSHSLLMEAKNLLLRKLCWLYDDREEIHQDSRSALSTPPDIAVASSSSTTAITDSFAATAHINNNRDDDDDGDLVKIQKHPSSMSKSSSSLSIDVVRKLATLYDRLCETLSLNTCQELVENKDNNINNSHNSSSLFVRSGKSSNNEDTTTINNNNNDDDKFQIPPESRTTITTATLQPWQLQWELYQALHLTSLLLLIELQKIMKMTMALSCSSSVEAILEKQQTILRTTIRQCQYCSSLLLSSSSLSSSQSKGGIFQATKTNMSTEEDECYLHHDHDNTQFIETPTSIVSMANHPFLLSCSWQKRIQHVKNEYPTLLLPPPAEQEETEFETNLLSYLNKEELAMEAQTLMRMADTPIPR
jgi:hypothetical protein